MGFQITTLAVLLDEISDDLELSIFQGGIVLGITAFMGILTAIISGPLIDYVGTRRSIVVVCVLIGIAGAMRGTANGFSTLLLFSFLLGIFQPVLPVSLIKINRLWFGNHQLGLASGIMSAGFALGLMLGARLSASVLSPELGGWRYVLVFLGAATILIGIIWWLIYPRQEPSYATAIDFSILYQQVLTVSKIPTIWILGGVGLGITGLMFGIVGYVPSYLRELGWADVDADSTVAVFFLASLTGVVPLSIMSDKLQSRRTAIVFAILMLTLGTSLLFFVEDNRTGVFIAMVVAGCCFDGFMAIHAAMISEVEGIATTMIGTAIGFSLAIRNVGPTIGPPLGNSFAGLGLSAPFLVWVAFGVMAMVLMISLFPKSTT